MVSADEGTPAAQAGLRPDDVIVALDGRPIGSAGALTRTVGMMRPGEQVTLTLYRGGQKQDRKVTLGTRPDIEGFSTEALPARRRSPISGSAWASVTREGPSERARCRRGPSSPGSSRARWQSAPD